MLDWLRNVNVDSKWWHWSYIPEWLGGVLLTLAVWAFFRFTLPLCRAFDPHDPALNHPYSHHNMFPNYTVPFVSWVLPFVWCIFLEKIVRIVFQERVGPVWMHVVHSLAICTAEANFLAMVLTDPLKNFAGRMRPDYVSRLVEYADFDPNNVSQEVYDTICDMTDHVIVDGRKSFPSGHASITFAGWTVAALFVFTRLFNGNAKVMTFPPAAVLAVAINGIVPAIVAVSRTRDYRHNYGDVLAGAVLGVLCGFTAFVMHFSLKTDVPRNRKKNSVEASCTPMSDTLQMQADMIVPMTAM